MAVVEYFKQVGDSRKLSCGSSLIYGADSKGSVWDLCNYHVPSGLVRNQLYVLTILGGICN